MEIDDKELIDMVFLIKDALNQAKESVDKLEKADKILTKKLRREAGMSEDVQHSLHI